MRSAVSWLDGPEDRPARRGDVYWIDPDPAAGREMKDRHRFVVIPTPREINALGVRMTVTGGGVYTRDMGLAVPITRRDTNGVAVAIGCAASTSRRVCVRAAPVSSRPSIR